MLLPSEELKKRILDHLLWDGRVDVSRVDVEVVEGRVRLSGSVPSFSVLRVAERDVWSVRGVQEVRNELTVAGPEHAKPPSDSQLKKRVGDALKWSPAVDASDLLVDVKEGVVTVGGSVPSYSQKLKVDDIVSEIHGVARLINVVSVVPSKAILDRTLAMRIVDALGTDSQLPFESVDVKVDRGKVILGGSVAAPGQRSIIQQKVEHILGVREIENRIVVQPV
ncbi:MAG: BON domain-containing protein [Chitinispirillaceae bacterium]